MRIRPAQVVPKHDYSRPPELTYYEYTYWYQTESTSLSWLTARSHERKSLMLYYEITVLLRTLSY